MECLTDIKSSKLYKSFQENEALLDSLLFNIPEAIVMLDGQRQIVYWNHLAEQITGWLAAETIGHSIEEICYEMGVGYSFNEIEEQLKMKGLCSYELASYHKNGKCIYLDVNIRKTNETQDKNGRSVGIIASFRDITKYKEVELNSDKKCKEYVDIIESFSEGLFINDFENREFYCSQAWKRRLGIEDLSYKEIELVYKTLVHPDDLKIVENAFLNVIKNRDNYLRAEYRVKTVDAGYIWVLCQARFTYNNEGKAVRDYGIYIDITKSKMLEDEIRVQKDLFETVIDNMPLPFMIFDANGDLVVENAEMRTGRWGIENFASLDKAYKTFEAWDSNEHRVVKKDSPACKALSGEFIKDKIIFVNYDNKQIIIELSSFPIYDKDNVLISAGVFFRDITEDFQNQNVIKLQQEKLLKSKRDKIEVLKNSIKMKDEFLSLISHEFKTPITVILSAIQSMRYICKDDLSEKANKYLNMIMQNSNRELKLVNNILDITRINEKYQKVNRRNMDIVFLTRSITESIKVYSEKKGVELSFSSTVTEQVMGMDEEKYERILLNLLSNAVKYTPNGNVIEVKLFKKVVDHRCKVCIQVKDSGIGIPEDKHKHIFARFGQVDSSLSRQAEGTGLGLSLVKLLVDLLGGEITLESNVGKGSTFTVVLPARKVKESNVESVQEIKNFRLIQAIDIEFSDVYM